MANEHKLIVELEPPISFTVANATGIEKGTTLKMTDPRTAIAAGTVGDTCAGIAASEKIASDGNTQLGVYRKGIFRGLASGAITVGSAVIHTTAANTLTVATATSLQIWGTSLETVANGETFLYELNPHNNAAAV